MLGLALRGLLTVMGAVLALAGLGSLEADLAGWDRWIRENGELARTSAVIIGIGVIVLSTVGPRGLHHVRPRATSEISSDTPASSETIWLRNQFTQLSARYDGVMRLIADKSEKSLRFEIDDQREAISKPTNGGRVVQVVDLTLTDEVPEGGLTEPMIVQRTISRVFPDKRRLILAHQSRELAQEMVRLTESNPPPVPSLMFHHEWFGKSEYEDVVHRETEAAFKQVYERDLGARVAANLAQLDELGFADEPDRHAPDVGVAWSSVRRLAAFIARCADRLDPPSSSAATSSQDQT